MEMKNVSKLVVPIANQVVTFDKKATDSVSNYATKTTNIGTLTRLRIIGKVWSESYMNQTRVYYHNENGTEVSKNMTPGSNTSFDITAYLNTENSDTNYWNVLTAYCYWNDNYAYYKNIIVRVAKTGSGNLEVYATSGPSTSYSGLIKLTIESVRADVKKIEDVNEEMIWGSEDAYPYRQLECLNMYGAYIDTQSKPGKHFYFLNCKFPSYFQGSSAWNFVYGTAGYSTRWWFGMYGNSTTASMSQVIYQRLKNNANTPVAKLSSLNPGTMYQVRIRNYGNASNNSTYWLALQDIDNSSEIYGQYYNATSYSMNLASMPTIQINRQAYYSTSTTTTSSYNVPGFGSFSVYRYFIRETDGASPIYFDAYPVQRKSDGVCGLYDIYGSAFYPCQGDTSSTCGGAIVSEYFEPSSLL